VIDKEMESNTLVVGEQDELGVSELFTDEINWVSGYPPESAFSAHVKIRYTSKIYPASISLHENGGAHIVFETPLRDITPGQAAVIYSGEEVLGSGLIRSSQSLNENQFVQLISLESIK
jgi:tRNA-specific 2-thiouridylase